MDLDLGNPEYDDLMFQIAFAITHKLPAARRDLRRRENVDYIAKRVAERLRQIYDLNRKPARETHLSYLLTPPPGLKD